MDMPARVITEDKRVTAYLSGEIDHHSAQEMREAIDAAVERAQPETLVLDFREVTFMDSSGIGLVLGRYKLVSSMNGQVELSGITGQLRKVMRLAGLDRLVKFEKGNEVKK
jgi:stage II sporulation protein AA (anti-sigma F factor antagonist)